MIPRYQTERMTQTWSDENKYRLWIEIELAVLHHSTKHKIIPIESLDAGIAFKKSRRIIDFDMKKFVRACLREEKKTHHDVVAFIHTLEKTLGGKAGKFLHYGMTSSDLCDTAYAMQMKFALAIINTSLIGLQHAIHEKAKKYQNVHMIGRTHGRYAEPLTFGLMLLLYVDEIQRHMDRIVETSVRASVGKISGAVGTYSHLKPAIEKDVLKDMGLNVPNITNQIVQRDRYAEVFSLLALIGCTIEKLALQFRHLSRDEVAEVFEPFGKDQKGSSSMPHKRNPIKSENICGMARMLRGYAGTALENVALWHERDISHSSVERIIGPDAFNLLHFMILRMTSIVKGMQVDALQMQHHVDDAPWYSQTRMLDEIKDGMSRKMAHDFMQANPGRSHNRGRMALEKHLKWVEHIFRRIKL